MFLILDLNKMRGGGQENKIKRLSSNLSTATRLQKYHPNFFRIVRMWKTIHNFSGLLLKSMALNANTAHQW